MFSCEHRQERLDGRFSISRARTLPSCRPDFARRCIPRLTVDWNGRQAVNACDANLWGCHLGHARAGSSSSSSVAVSDAVYHAAVSPSRDAKNRSGCGRRSETADVAHYLPLCILQPATSPSPTHQLHNVYPQLLLPQHHRMFHSSPPVRSSGVGPRYPNPELSKKL